DRSRDGHRPAPGRENRGTRRPARSHEAQNSRQVLDSSESETQKVGTPPMINQASQMQSHSNDPFEIEAMAALRRDLHANPELGFEEVRTSAIEAENLAEEGVEVHRGRGRSVVVGALRIRNGTRLIALRADMD